MCAHSDLGEVRSTPGTLCVEKKCVILSANLATTWTRASHASSLFEQSVRAVLRGLTPPRFVRHGIPEQGNGGNSDSDREDDLFDDHVPTRELAAMSIGSTKPAGKGTSRSTTTVTKKKASTASMSFSERVKSRFGDTSTPAPTLAVRWQRRPSSLFHLYDGIPP